MTHLEHVAVAYWLCARGYFDDEREIIRYFENPDEWIARHEWLLDLYKPAGEVTEGDTIALTARVQAEASAPLSPAVDKSGLIATTIRHSPSATSSEFTSKPEHPEPKPDSNVPRDALAGPHADTFGGLAA